MKIVLKDMSEVCEIALLIEDDCNGHIDALKGIRDYAANTAEYSPENKEE